MEFGETKFGEGIDSYWWTVSINTCSNPLGYSYNMHIYIYIFTRQFNATCMSIYRYLILLKHGRYHYSNPFL